VSIVFKNLSKEFGAVCALSDVNLSFEQGKIYGLLGRNGAGKSTLLNVLTGRIFASGGEVTIDGEQAADNDRAQRKVYLMSEQNMYPLSMRVREAFKWTKEFYPDFDAEYAARLADEFSLNTGKKTAALSTGYNSIFKLIIGLSVNTPYILFDEPVLGLDANHRDVFYRLLVERYSEKPCCVVISTHLIEEVSAIVEDVVIIKQGKIIRQESREELLGGGYAVSGTASAVESFINGREVIGIDAIGGLKTAYVLGKRPSDSPEGLEITAMDLQKLFIQLTNA